MDKTSPFSHHQLVPSLEQLVPPPLYIRHLRVQVHEPVVQPVHGSCYLAHDGTHGVGVSAHVGGVKDGGVEVFLEEGDVQSHCQGIHAVGADVHRLLLGSGGRVGETFTPPVPIPIKFGGLVELAELVVLGQKEEVGVWVLLATCQGVDTFILGLEIVACGEDHVFGTSNAISIDQVGNDGGEESTALAGFISVVSSFALLQGHLHCPLNVSVVGDGNWSQSHQRSVAIVELVQLLSIGSLNLQKVIHGLGNIATQTNRVWPASIVKPVVDPQHEPQPQIQRIEDELGTQQGIRQTESHATVICPHPHLSPLVQHLILDFL